MNKNVFWQIISIIFALIFGYLSVIGGKVFQLNVNEAEANKALEKAAKKAGLTAVSYTHLDVYKRQAKR